MKLLIITQKVDINDDILGFFHGWLKKLAEKVKSIDVICLQKGEYNLPNNVKIHSLGKESMRKASHKKADTNLWHSHAIRRFVFLFRFYRYICRERKNYDAVFVHMNQIYVILGGLFWKFWRKKVSLWYAHGRTDWRLRLAEKITDVIFTSTKEGFRIKSKKVRIVGQGIDIVLFQPRNQKSKIKSQKFIILSVGRISPSKNYETLIKAIERLENKNLEIKIIGGVGLSKDKNYLERLKKLIKEKRLENIIRFVGPKPYKEIVQFLQSADLFVNMSQTGSLDKAVLEAMACGLPILTCNEAFKDVLRDYAKLLMYPKKDFKALAKKIDFFMKLSAKNREKISQDLRQIVVENHSLDSLIRKISSILKK